MIVALLPDSGIFSALPYLSPFGSKGGSLSENMVLLKADRSDQTIDIIRVIDTHFFIVQ